MVFPYKRVLDKSYVADLQGFKNLAGLTTPYTMKKELLSKDHHFYIHNTGNNRERIFLNPDNKAYFLRLFQHHCNGSCTLLAYSLLDNQFHFLVKVNADGITATNALARFFNAYAKAFNKYCGRNGSLFTKNFKRSKIESAAAFKNTVATIHFMPKDYLGADFQDYPWSSYQAVIEGDATYCAAGQCRDHFRSIEDYYLIHQKLKNRPRPALT